MVVMDGGVVVVTILLAAFAEPFHTDGGGDGVDTCCLDGCK